MKKKKLFLVKFTVVAGMLGLFSPSVSVNQIDVQSSNDYTAAPFVASLSLFNTAEARGRRGGGVHRSGNRARTRPAARPTTRPAPAAGPLMAETMAAPVSRTTRRDWAFRQPSSWFLT